MALHDEDLAVVVSSSLTQKRQGPAPPWDTAETRV